MQEKGLNFMKEKFPWYFELGTGKKYYLVVTDDIDSISSAAAMIHRYPQLEIGYYYDFRSGLYKKQGIDESIEKIGVDLSHPGTMKCISNHCTRINDSDSFNPNDINFTTLAGVTAFGKNHYFKKYGMSTLFKILSLESHPLTDEGLELVLCVDSGYKGYYCRDGYDDKKAQKEYLQAMDYTRALDIMAERKPADFIRLQSKWNLHSKVKVGANGLEFMNPIDLEGFLGKLDISYNPKMLEGKFELIEKHDSFPGVFKTYDKSDMYSFVITSTKDKGVKYSMKVE